MAGLRQSTRRNMLLAVTEEHAAWNHGTEWAWQCDAVVDGTFLRDLIALASQAPTEKVRRFCEEWGE